MLVDGTHYVGAATESELWAPAKTWSAVERFTLQVGHELAALGYRGWYDVDFIAAVDHQLWALEINARRTGPTVVLTIAERLAAIRPGPPSAVICCDSIPLPRRYDAAEVFEAFTQSKPCMSEDVIPTAFFGTDAMEPSLGLAATGTDIERARALLECAADDIVRRLWDR